MKGGRRRKENDMEDQNRTAGRPPADTLEFPRILGRAVVGILAERGHSKLMHDGLADKHSSSSLEGSHSCAVPSVWHPSGHTTFTTFSRKIIILEIF
jgi:hypothetical protein